MHDDASAVQNILSLSGVDVLDVEVANTLLSGLADGHLNPTTTETVGETTFHDLAEPTVGGQLLDDMDESQQETSMDGLSLPSPPS